MIFKKFLIYLNSYKNYLGIRVYILLIVSPVVALSEGFGIFLFLPIIQSFSDGAKYESKNILLNQIYVFFESLLLDFGIGFVLVFIVVLFLIKGVAAFIIISITAKYRANISANIKLQFYNVIRYMSMGYYNKTNTGQLLNLINEQSNRAGVGFYHLTQFIFQAVSAFIYLSLAILAAPAFGLTALLSGFCILCLLQILSRYVKRLSIEMVNEGGELAKVFIQIIHGFKYLKSTGQVIKLKDKIYLSIKNLKNCQVKVGIAHGFTQAVREPISVILILSLASYELSKEDGNLSFVLISIVLFYRSVNALLSIQTQWQATLEHIGSLESIQQNLEEIQASSEKHGMIEKNKLNQEIILQGVFYRYHSKSELVLKNINITVKACTLVGFVGPSGSGKTTLVDLLTLIYSPSGGALLIDGLNGRDLDPDNWRSQIGYVSQDSVIFDDSIDNNISLFDESVDSHRVKMAAKMANLHDFIESLPDQYKTMVGDRGVRLSGGQKQRLFIAREICRKPSILILDEATSALDSIAEAEIQKSIEYLKGKLTIIIIAHRLGSVRSADIIHVIDKGILIESGDYKTLSCDKNSLFSELLKGN